VVVMGQRTVVGAQGSAVGSAVVTGSNDGGVAVAVSIPLAPS
jgi:hypothetical protein